MQKGLTTILILGSILAVDTHQPAKAALTQPMTPNKEHAQTAPAGWTYYPDWAPSYYYYEPVVPEYYYYEPVVPVVPYYYAPQPYYVQPGLSFNISL
jgi:hypothetical protein